MDPSAVNKLVLLLQKQQEEQANPQKQLFELLKANSSLVASNFAGDAIKSFHYEPENGKTLVVWYKRHEDIFTVEFAQLDDAAKSRLFLQKLVAAADDK